MTDYRIWPFFLSCDYLGDIVGLSLSQGDSFQKVIASGVISRVTPSAISIAFDDSQDIFDLDDSTQYRIIKLANDVTYRRLQKWVQLLWLKYFCAFDRQSLSSSNTLPSVPLRTSWQWLPILLHVATSIHCFKNQMVSVVSCSCCSNMVH